MIKLERFVFSDSSEYLELAKDDVELKKYFTLAYCKDNEEAKDLMELCIQSTNYESFKILNDNNRIVGIILGEKKPKNVIEVCYFIGKKHRGRGYCKETIKEFARYLSENTEYTELEFCVFNTNKKSRYFVEKNLKLKPKILYEGIAVYKSQLEELFN